MTRRIASLFAACFMAAAAFGATAQAQTATTKIAVVNIQEIMRDSTAAKSVREQLDSKQKAYRAEMEKQETSLRKEEQELAKQRSVLAADAFEKKLREFQTKFTSAQKDVQTKKGALDNAFGQALNDIQKAVYDIVSGLAKERGYTVVVPTSQLLYAEPGLDISKEVLEKLNKQLPKVSVKF